MKNEHTEAPWFAVEYAGYIDIQMKDEYGEPSLFNRDYFAENAEANSVLAATAPIMYDALLVAVEAFSNVHISHNNTSKMALEYMKEALKKAKQ